MWFKFKYPDGATKDQVIELLTKNVSTFKQSKLEGLTDEKDSIRDYTLELKSDQVDKDFRLWVAFFLRGRGYKQFFIEEHGELDWENIEKVILSYSLVLYDNTGVAHTHAVILKLKNVEKVERFNINVLKGNEALFKISLQTTIEMFKYGFTFTSEPLSEKYSKIERELEKSGWMMRREGNHVIQQYNTGLEMLKESIRLSADYELVEEN